MKFVLVVFLACILLSPPVLAADPASATSVRLPEAASNPWEGFYIGGHVGYAFGTSSYLGAPTATPASGTVGI
jgi:outer membrane immunogenic protein